MSNLQIFKIQISLSTTLPQQQVLIYNKDRTLEGQFPLNKEIKKMAKGRKKFFAMADVSGTELNIMGFAEWQDW